MNKRPAFFLSPQNCRTFLVFLNRVVLTAKPRVITSFVTGFFLEVTVYSTFQNNVTECFLVAVFLLGTPLPCMRNGYFREQKEIISFEKKRNQACFGQIISLLNLMFIGPCIIVIVEE